MPQQVPVQATATTGSDVPQKQSNLDVSHQSNILATTLREDGDAPTSGTQAQTTSSSTKGANCLPLTNADGNKSQDQQQTISDAPQPSVPVDDTQLNKQNAAPNNPTITSEGSNNIDNKNNTDGSFRDNQQHQRAVPQLPPTTIAATATTTPAPTAKLNGLKNRIIQRPPPLVLDKVSNFYDNDTNSCIVQPLKQQQQHQNQKQQLQRQSSHNNPAPPISFSGGATRTTTRPNQDHPQHQVTPTVGEHHKTNLVTHFGAGQTDETFISDRTSSNSSSNNNNGQVNTANQKFWASLNENASRNRALANARSVSVTNNECKHARLPESTPSIINANDANGSLGPDLIIKQRNSSGNISSSRVVSTLSARKQHELHDQLHDQQRNHRSLPHQSITKTQSLNQQTGNQLDFTNKDQLNISDDLDDCATTSERDGGNLIGVDNITPPAFDLRLPPNHLDEPPASATSSRPRSNNPFLDQNDDDFEEYRNSIRSESASRDSFSSQNRNNFHKRPASFIAATDRLSGFTKAASDFATKQQIIEEKLNDLHIDNKLQGSTVSNSNQADDSQSFSQQMVPSWQQLDRPDSHAIYQRLAQPNSSQTPLYDSLTNQSNHGPNERYIKSLNEPTISVDSESTICQPPPSTTMQLPHWTEAIYELNNAILETRSIAGGAENGQFVYIVENGDIVLELDSIKVSGFTVAEFNELVDSKQFHLLKAVQRKHSHGLTLDLREYLNLSFPKDSKDKQLQNIVRDNIYRRTIPCTTRAPKEGEVDKVDYHFLTQEQFIDLNKRGMLLECGVYVGHYYGTLKPSCDLSLLKENSQETQHDENSNRLRQAWDTNHPAVEMIMKRDASHPQASSVIVEHPLYENQESLRIQQQHDNSDGSSSMNDNKLNQGGNNFSNNITDPAAPNIVAVDSEALPPGWERVMDQTHGTYYIDHNTQRTQYERPYEVELTKGSMGFGFTLVEADSGLLLVRSIISGGPASMNATIRPGDILISAVGVSVTGLQHTDIARLFSTFAVGDRVRLTFARSNYILDDNLVPDEYLFSNGTNGDLAIAVNPKNYQLNNLGALPIEQSPHIVVNQEFEYIKVVLKRGEQGFGFTISDSIAGQKVRKIQNHDICANLKQGDILVNLNGQDITKLTHKEVVERLKNCSSGEDVALTIKRKKRFRSKTPLAMHTDATGEYSLDSTPQRNCRTPSLDGLMLKRSAAIYNSEDLSSNVSRSLFHPPPSEGQPVQQHPHVDVSGYGASSLMSGLPPAPHVDKTFEQQLYGSLPVTRPQPIYGEHMPISASLNHQLNNPHYFTHQFDNKQALPHPPDSTLENSHNKDLIGASSTEMKSNSIRLSDVIYRDNLSNSVHDSDVSQLQQQQSRYHANLQNNDFLHVNQYNNFMNNDKLMMMQMQQPRYQPQIYSSDYHQVPLYSNSEVMKNELLQQQHQEQPIDELGPSLPAKLPVTQYQHNLVSQPLNNFQDNFYANNEEIAFQNMQYGYLPQASQMPVAPADQFTFMRPISHETPHEEHDEYEYHNVDLERENTDSNWGIRLIGGAEVDRAISIGSMIFGGVASKSGKLKSGDEIISIDGVSVVGATHQHVVQLISACANRVSLVVRRKAFAEACEVVLSKNMDEGFGFVIISNENCAVIGKIIEGSPADRCKQLRVRDCIIAVNGRYITPDMKHPEIVNMIKECGSTLRLRIIPVDCYTVKLIKDMQNDSFGFRMRGGSEYDGTPLYIVRVEPNGQAHGLLNVGDQILEINNIPTVGMTHQQAATIIKYSDPIVKLKLRRNYVTPPSLLVDSPRSLQKYNQIAEMKQVSVVSTPNMQPVGANDASFASLPPNVNLLSQPPQQMMAMMNQGMQQMPSAPAPQLNHQPIYDHHSMTYVDQGSLYAR